MLARAISIACGLVLSAIIVPSDESPKVITEVRTATRTSNDEPVAPVSVVEMDNYLVAYASSQPARPGQLGTGDDIRLYDPRSASRRVLFSEPGLSVSQLVWSPDDNFLAFVGREVGNADVSTINVVSLSGGRLELEHEPANCHSPAWSSDSSQVVFACSYYDRPTGVFAVAASGGPMQRLTTDGAYETTAAAWSADNQQLADVLDYGSFSRLGLRQVGEARERVLQVSDRHVSSPPIWTPDGLSLLVVQSADGNPPPPATISQINVATGAAVHLLSDVSGSPLNLQFSPNAQHLVVTRQVVNNSAPDVEIMAWPSLKSEALYAAVQYGFREAAINFGQMLPGPGARYLALGDSVAAGEGICYDWIWQGLTADDVPWQRINRPDRCGRPQDANAACHRSDQAYPWVLTETRGWHLSDLACTGASADNGLLQPRVFSDAAQGPAQVSGMTLSLFRPAVISLTMGADDLQFAEWLKACYGPVRAACTSDANRRVLDAQLDIVQDHVLQVLRTIRSLGRANGQVPAVILTTYYDPFPAALTHCRDLSPLAAAGADLTADELAWLKQGLARLNERIVRAAAGFTNVTLVNLGDVMAGHALCSADPWVYGPSILTAGLNTRNPAPFHPTPAGQRAIASRIAAVIG